LGGLTFFNSEGRKNRKKEKKERSTLASHFTLGEAVGCTGGLECFEEGSTGIRNKKRAKKRAERVKGLGRRDRVLTRGSHRQKKSGNKGEGRETTCEFRLKKSRRK